MLSDSVVICLKVSLHSSSSVTSPQPSGSSKVYAQHCKGQTRISFCICQYMYTWISELYESEHVLRKIHHCTFWPKISQWPFFRIQPKKFILYITNSDFFSQRPFFRISALTYSNIIQITPISYFLHFIPLIYPYIHTYILFFRFYTLLSTLVTINTTYAFYFFRNSSLHKQPFIIAHFHSLLHILCITTR